MEKELKNPEFLIRQRQIVESFRQLTMASYRQLEEIDKQRDEINKSIQVTIETNRKYAEGRRAEAQQALKQARHRLGEAKLEPLIKTVEYIPEVEENPKKTDFVFAVQEVLDTAIELEVLVSELAEERARKRKKQLTIIGVITIAIVLLVTLVISSYLTARENARIAAEEAFAQEMATATQVFADATATQETILATATQVSADATATQETILATATQVSADATATQETILGTATRVSADATATQETILGTAKRASADATATVAAIATATQRAELASRTVYVNDRSTFSSSYYAIIDRVVFDIGYFDVYFESRGNSDLRKPETSCVIERPGGKVIKLTDYSTPVRTSTNYRGYLRFPSNVIKAGSSYYFRYSCRSDYSDVFLFDGSSIHP